MSLASGTRLGPYEVIAPLGAGGMGEVYRARDTKLDRDVALKILPESFATDPDRLMRFTREAKTLASLNHPNIAAIYGIEDHALVMELVEGEDLSVPLARGVMPLDDALRIARQIVDALEAAHEAGVIHRDLKPANIKVRADGTVKVLDFGLAKALDSGPGTQAPGPTMTSPAMTAMGVVLGTAAYMAPEQARGRAVDRRADIWAFGVVLYEMLTGRPAFEGDDVSTTMANVLKEDIDWQAVPANVSVAVRRLLRRCLEKDPKRRLGYVGDARLELDEPDPVGAPPGVAMTPPPSLVARFWPLAAGLAIAAAAVVWTVSRPIATGRLARLSVLAPPDTTLYPDSNGLAISPDGTMVAFLTATAAPMGGQLWVRPLDSTEAQAVEGATDAALPFWSPDSTRIGFFTIGGKLKTIDVSSRRVLELCDADLGRGAAWSPSGVIVFAPDVSGPLYRVPDTGGTPQPVTALDAAHNEVAHRFPLFLPDGDHFLYAALPGKNGAFEIFASSLGDSSRALVGSMESAPVYADPGWLVYARRGVLTAVPFDSGALRISGDAVPLEDAPTNLLDSRFAVTAGRATSMSATGSLAYFSAPSVNTVARWYDAKGQRTGTLDLPPGYYSAVVISPDGVSAAAARSVSPSESDLWLVDLQRGGVAQPLSSGRGLNAVPVWSPDSTRVLFASDRDGPLNIYLKTIGDTSPERLLYGSPVMFKYPTDWHGDTIVVLQIDEQGAQNVYTLPGSGGALKPLVRGPGPDRGIAVSPDGKWLMHGSAETGVDQLYATSFPEPGRRVRVSSQGAGPTVGAWWTRDMRQILYLGPDSRTLWQVDVALGPTIRPGTPRKVGTFPPDLRSVSAMPDRQRFLVIEPERTGAGSITIVQHLLARLKK